MITANITTTVHNIDGSETVETVAVQFPVRGYNKLLNRHLDQIIAQSNANVRAGTESGTVDIHFTLESE